MICTYIINKILNFNKLQWYFFYFLIEGDLFFINEIDPLFLTIPFLELNTKNLKV